MDKPIIRFGIFLIGSILSGILSNYLANLVVAIFGIWRDHLSISHLPIHIQAGCVFAFFSLIGIATKRLWIGTALILCATSLLQLLFFSLYANSPFDIWLRSNMYVFFFLVIAAIINHLLLQQLCKRIKYDLKTTTFFSRKLSSRSGFTLIEILVALAIIIALSAITYPIVGKAMRKADETRIQTHMKQAAVALLLYAEDYGGYNAMPKYDVAKDLVAQIPLCSKPDNWAPSCKYRNEEPMFGSVGYFRPVIDKHHENDSETPSWEELTLESSQAILSNPFYGSTVPCKFSYGLWNSNQQEVIEAGLECAKQGKSFHLPDKLVQIRLDTSLRIKKYPTNVKTPFLGADWSNAFY